MTIDRTLKDQFTRQPAAKKRSKWLLKSLLGLDNSGLLQIFEFQSNAEDRRRPGEKILALSGRNWKSTSLMIGQLIEVTAGSAWPTQILFSSSTWAMQYVSVCVCVCPFVIFLLVFMYRHVKE